MTTAMLTRMISHRKLARVVAVTIFIAVEKGKLGLKKPAKVIPMRTWVMALLNHLLPVTRPRGDALRYPRTRTRMEGGAVTLLLQPPILEKPLVSGLVISRECLGTPMAWSLPTRLPRLKNHIGHQ